MMLLDMQAEVDGGAHLLGGALLSSPTTTCTSGTIADSLLGRARNVARVPLGTRALQEAKEAAQNAIPLSEGVDQDDLRVFYDLLAVTAPYTRTLALRCARATTRTQPAPLVV
jgi:hypothetical protein